MDAAPLEDILFGLRITSAKAAGPVRPRPDDFGFRPGTALLIGSPNHRPRIDAWSRHVLNRVNSNVRFIVSPKPEFFGVLTNIVIVQWIGGPEGSLYKSCRELDPADQSVLNTDYGLLLHGTDKGVA